MGSLTLWRCFPLLGVVSPEIIDAWDGNSLDNPTAIENLHLPGDGVDMGSGRAGRSQDGRRRERGATGDEPGPVGVWGEEGPAVAEETAVDRGGRRMMRWEGESMEVPLRE